VNGHDRALELAAAAIDFALTADERGRLEGHLKDCAACRRSVTGFGSDAATIAMLPHRTLEPLAKDAILAALLQGPARVSVIRYVAIAALLALLAATSVVVGAEILRRVENPAELMVAPSETPSATAIETARPSTQRVNPATCVDAPTVADLATLGGAGAAACYGSGDLTVLGIIPQGDPGFEVCPGREPAWLSCNDGSYLSTGPADEATFVPYAHDGEPLVARPVTGAAAAAGSPIRGFYSRFTGHYRDPRSADCRATDATDEYYSDVAALRARCEQTFVVTSIEVLEASAVPAPVLDGTWTMIAGPDGFPGGGTYLTSIAELDGRLFAVSAAPGDPTTFHLWTSPAGDAWEAIDTGAFAPGSIVSDGSRLIATAGLGGSPDTRFSTDGRSWQSLEGMDESSHPAGLVVDGHLVFAVGSQDIDAAIWRLSGDAWEAAGLENDSGWLGAQDASPAVVYRIVPTSRGWIAMGQGPPPGGSGLPEARVWSSGDGVQWTAEALPGNAAASALAGIGLWRDTEVVVGEANPAFAPSAAWVKRGDAWEAATFNGTSPAGTLGSVVGVNGILIAIGYDDRSSVGESLQSVVWGSTDGASWWSMPRGDLSSGLANNVFVTREGRILGPGLRFDGRATGGFASPSGPALYELTADGTGG
jgi:hypothetical protein